MRITSKPSHFGLFSSRFLRLPKTVLLTTPSPALLTATTQCLHSWPRLSLLSFSRPRPHLDLRSPLRLHSCDVTAAPDGYQGERRGQPGFCGRAQVRSRHASETPRSGQCGARKNSAGSSSPAIARWLERRAIRSSVPPFPSLPANGEYHIPVL